MQDKTCSRWPPARASAFRHRGPHFQLSKSSVLCVASSCFFTFMLNFTSMRLRNLPYDSFSHGHSAGDLPTVCVSTPSWSCGVASKILSSIKSGKSMDVAAFGWDDNVLEELERHQLGILRIGTDCSARCFPTSKINRFLWSFYRTALRWSRVLWLWPMRGLSPSKVINFCKAQTSKQPTWGSIQMLLVLENGQAGLCPELTLPCGSRRLKTQSKASFRFETFPRSLRNVFLFKILTTQAFARP